MGNDRAANDGPRAAQPAFGAMLRQFRVAAGLTQEELAQRSGLSARAISNLERGQTSRPFRSSARFLAKALGLPETAAAEFIATARGGAPPSDGQRQAAARVPPQFALAAEMDGPGTGSTVVKSGATAAAVASRPAAAGGPGLDHPPPGALAGQPPAQLPADIADFTGRDLELRLLQDMLTSPDHADPGAVRIVVIAGAAGLGKTTIAVHAAHQVRDLFPDGQLYVDLAGTRPEPAAPGEVLGRFLRDLGVEGDEVPAGDEERAALYRTRLSGRRVLILLDDMKDVPQARPLLPGSSTCVVLATTRNRTPSVVSTEFIGLDTLTDPEALELFSRIVGDGRPAAEPEATREVLAACAGLPLAIRVCAARLATRRRWLIGTMAARLRDERRRLDELQLADLEVRAGFRISYDSLGADRRLADPARAFRLLGLWPGQKISLSAAAALTGEREADLAAALETLVDTNLLESPAPNWYQFHDLLRLFARELAQAEESQSEQDEAMERLLRWYMGTALAAAERLSPHRYRMPSSEPRVPYLALDSAEAALAWYDSERESVITANRQAAAAGLHDTAWRLATALFPLFNRRHNWTDCITVSRIALDSAGKAGSPPGQAWAMNNLGGALSMVGDTDGLGLIAEALALRQEISDLDGEIQSAITLVNAAYTLQGVETAFAQSVQCLKILREAGKPAALGIGLNNHGEFCLELGRLDEAADCFAEALSIWREVGDYGHGHVLHNLGRVYLESGCLDDAIASLTEAYRLHIASGDLRGQAIALKHLGLARHQVGRADQARESLTAALRLFEDLHEDTEAEEIRRDLKEGFPG